MSQSISLAYGATLATAGVNSKFYDILGSNGIISGFNVIPGAGLAVQIAHTPDASGLLMVNGCAIKESVALTTDIAIAANATGSTRTDMVYAYYDHAASAVCIYLVSTGSTTPAAPTLTCKLAEIDVPNGAVSISAGNIRNVSKLKTIKTLSDYAAASNIFSNGGFIQDNNGNELIKFAVTASAVNEVTVKNNIAGSAPEIQATGGDTNIDINVIPKGTGKLKVSGNTVWHAGNDGAGSTSDTDLLDGQHGAYYLAWGNFTGLPSSFTPSTHAHSDATQSVAGFFSTVDKTKLDGCETSSQKNSSITKAEIEAKLTGSIGTHSHGVEHIYRSDLCSFLEFDSNTMVCSKTSDAGAWCGDSAYKYTSASADVSVATFSADTLRFNRYAAIFRMKTSSLTTNVTNMVIATISRKTGASTSTVIKTANVTPAMFGSTGVYKSFYVEFDFNATAYNNVLEFAVTAPMQTANIMVSLDSVTIMPVGTAVIGM